jgi:hypothetical protein
MRLAGLGGIVAWARRGAGIRGAQQHNDLMTTEWAAVIALVRLRIGMTTDNPYGVCSGRSGLSNRQCRH